MNWLQKTSQLNSPITVGTIFEALLEGVKDITWAIGEINSLGDMGACEEIQRLGGMPRIDGSAAAANGIASALMRGLGCDGYPDAPDGENPQAMQPMQMPNLGVQEEPMSMPSTEIG